MTNEIIFKTRVDTGTTSKDLAAISTELGKIDEGTKTVGKDSAAQLEALNAKIKAGGMSARELSRAVNEYMTIARDAGRDSPIGRQAIADAAILTDEIKDLRNEINRSAHDGANMQAALQLGSTVVAGYGAAKGAMSLLGVESESVEQAQRKLIAVTATLNGLEQIRAALEKESFLMMKAKALQTKVLTLATVSYNVAVGGSVGVMKALRLAMLAIPIFAIIAGIVFLITNFEKAKEITQDVIDKFNNMGGVMKKILDAILFPFILQVRLVNKALEMLGITSTKAATEAEKSAERQRVAYAKMVADQRKETDKRIADNERQQDSIESTYDFEIAKAKAAGKDTSDLERQKREEMRKTYVEQLKNLEMSARLNVGNAQEMKKILDQVSEYRKNILKIDQDEELATITQTTTARKKGADAAKEAEKQRVDAAAKELERERLLRDYFIASIDDENVRKLMQMQEQHKREREELIAKYGQDAELIKGLEAKQFDERMALENEWVEAQRKIKTDAEIAAFEATRRNEMAALELKLIALEKEGQDTYAVRQQILEAEMLQALENTELTENEKLLIKAKYDKAIDDMDKEAADKEIARAKQVVDEKERIQKQLYDSINNLTETAFIIGDALGKQDEKSKEKRARAQFKITKAMQLGMAINDGYKAITASLAQSPVAIGAIPNPAGIASLAFAASTAAANVAKIAASKFQGGGTAGIEPPSPSIPQVGAPEIPQAPNAQTTQTAGLVNNNKVVVVDSEIKAVMDSSQQIQVVSSFG
jgi:hypothetical protein